MNTTTYDHTTLNNFLSDLHHTGLIASTCYVFPTSDDAIAAASETRNFTAWLVTWETAYAFNVH